MNTQEMMTTLVSAQLDDISSMVLNGDTLSLERWLGPILTQHLMSELDLTELDSDEAFIVVDAQYTATFGKEPDVRNVAVLCGCGWGSLSMPEDEVPAECPVCGGPLGHG